MSIPHPQYELLANRAHQHLAMKDQLIFDTLGDLEGKIDAQRCFKNTLTEEELKEKYGAHSDHELNELMKKEDRHYKNLSGTLSDKGANLARRNAELVAEKERRSKAWLQQVHYNGLGCSDLQISWQQITLTPWFTEKIEDRHDTFSAPCVQANKNRAEAQGGAVGEQPHPVMAAELVTDQEDTRPSERPAADGATLPNNARELETTFAGRKRKVRIPHLTGTTHSLPYKHASELALKSVRTEFV